MKSEKQGKFVILKRSKTITRAQRRTSFRLFLMPSMLIIVCKLTQMNKAWAKSLQTASTDHERSFLMFVSSSQRKQTSALTSVCVATLWFLVIFTGICVMQQTSVCQYPISFTHTHTHTQVSISQFCFCAATRSHMCPMKVIPRSNPSSSSSTWAEAAALTQTVKLQPA